MLKTLNIAIGNQKKVKQKHQIKKILKNISEPLNFSDASQADDTVKREQRNSLVESLL